jgi:membrane fusion protein (multidrug efflux system)/multidrug efflux system membrane fusion protein
MRPESARFLRPGPVPAWALAVTGLAWAALAVGCSRHGKAAPQGGDDRPPSKVNLERKVDLSRAEQRSLVQFVETVGVLEAEGQTDIAAGVNGLVDEVLFREGDEVTPQTILVKVDQRRYVAAAKVAEANVARAEASLNLARDVNRRAQQAGQGASAEEKAKALLNLSLSDAELQAAKSALDLARNNLERSHVRPPYRGRINQRKVTPGTYLEEKTVIATMADLSRLRLVGWVPETAMPTVRELLTQQARRLETVRLVLPLGCWLGGTGPWAGLVSARLAQEDQIPSGFDPEFTLMAFPKRTFQARIFYLSTVANPDTHMFECKAEVNFRGLEEVLRPGFTAKIRLPLQSNAQACFIPEESVRPTERGVIAFVPVQRQGRDGKTVWVAEARTIEPGFRSPGWVEVRQGITPGERIVRRGAEALEDGTPITFPENQ